jgi:hypothetical protein
MALVDTLLVFLVSLLVGALGIYVGARAVTGVEDYTYAVVTALVGSVVWVVVAFFVGWIPFLGPALAFLAYVAVLNARYPEGLGSAVAIALIAWVTALLVLYVLAVFDLATLDAIGIPGA